MNKLFIVLFLIVLNSTLTAQIPVCQGTYSVGGQISYIHQSEAGGSSSYSLFSFSPSFGYFFINQVLLGLSVTYNHQSTDEYSKNAYGFGPMLRFYINTENINPFLGFSYSYNKSKDNYNSENIYAEIVSSIGLDYFITNYFAIEGSINYSFDIQKMSNDYSTKEIDSNTFSLGIGAKYFIQ